MILGREIEIDGTKIGDGYPTYFIADIAANHDGNLDKAINLIHLAAKSGANAAKFQHFKAETIVSSEGFRSMGANKSHQTSWTKSVFDVYEEASLSFDWTPILERECRAAGITFFTSPYDIGLVDQVDEYVSAYKIVSGDITWHTIVEHIAKKEKPTILATGASNIGDIQSAVAAFMKHNTRLALLQCNTNYTGSLDNFKHLNLKVLDTYRSMFPSMVLGLSDHTVGYSSVLGAITLGASIIEKHFTDNRDAEGPDHKFSTTPLEWREMVMASRELEMALGTGLKKVEENELDTVVMQRRSIRLTRDILPNEKLVDTDLICLRPCPVDAVQPYDWSQVIGKKLLRGLKKGDYIKWTDLG